MTILRAALIQHPIKWLDVKANLEYYETQIEPLQQLDLIVLSETFATGFAVHEADFEHHEGATLHWMKRQAAKLNAVLAGSVLVSDQGEKYNRFYWVTPQQEVHYYDKRHLFCLGEEGRSVSAGQERVIVELKGFKVLLQTCYDLRFPVFSRNQDDYDVLLNIANWPAARRNAWDVLLQARSIENQCYVLAVNRIGEDGHGTAHNGGTVAIDYEGNTLVAAEDAQAQTIECELSMAQLQDYRQRFPALKDRDIFHIESAQ